MPPGAKKRKALKKKQQQQQQQQEESIGTSTNNNNGDNLHGGNGEHGSQDDRESDSNLSSPGSQGNDESGGKQEPSAAKEISDATQGLGSDTAVQRGADETKTILEKSPVSSYENSTQTAKNVASHDPCEKSEHGETSKSDENKEYPSTGLEKDNGKVATLPVSAAGASRQVESLRESQVPLLSEEKRLLLSGPPAVRTSWLSCCGLFEAMTASDR